MANVFFSKEFLSDTTTEPKVTEGENVTICRTVKIQEDTNPNSNSKTKDNSIFEETNPDQNSKRSKPPEAEES